MFPRGNGKNNIQVGQRLGVPYLRSLQPELEIRLPTIQGDKSSSIVCGSPGFVVENISSEHVVTLYQDGHGVMGISGVIWDCGLLCTDFLGNLATCVNNEVLCLSPLDTFLDLGCGTGVCGISALHLGAERVTFTDARICDALENNLDNLPEFFKPKSNFISFSWDAKMISEIESPARHIRGEWDCVICSDLLYDNKSHADLLNVLASIKFRIAIFSYKKRHDIPEENFFEQLEVFTNLYVVNFDKLKLFNLPRESTTGSGLYLVIAKKRDPRNNQMVV